MNSILLGVLFSVLILFSCYNSETYYCATGSSHSKVNGPYMLAGTYNGYNYFVNYVNGDTVYMYYISTYDYWYIGPTLGSTSVYAYCPYTTKTYLSCDGYWYYAYSSSFSQDSNMEVNSCSSTYCIKNSKHSYVNGNYVTGPYYYNSKNYFISYTNNFAVYMYYISSTGLWYIGPTLGSTAVYAYCPNGNTYYYCSYDWYYASSSSFLSDSNAIISAGSCPSSSPTAKPTSGSSSGNYNEDSDDQSSSNSKIITGLAIGLAVAFLVLVGYCYYKKQNKTVAEAEKPTDIALAVVTVASVASTTITTSQYQSQHQNENNNENNNENIRNDEKAEGLIQFDE